MRLQARGGWLLVEGAATAPHEPSLLDVFTAYVEATRATAPVGIPSPRAAVPVLAG